MLVALGALALIVLTVAALLLAGAVAAIVTGVVLVNVFATILCVRYRAVRHVNSARRDRWRPSSFRLPPEVTREPDDEPAHSLTIHRR
jgi:hypothetical protein